jgi:two-component system chemotaxis response regulator CheY
MASVLIVEDTDVQAALLRGFVRGTHSVVGTAQGADEAVRVALETDPDVVVMDLNLEEGNGIDATAAIKSLENSIPVIISTVHVNDEVKEQAVEAGADEYLFKPYGKRELLQAIDRVV